MRPYLNEQENNNEPMCAMTHHVMASHNVSMHLGATSGAIELTDVDLANKLVADWTPLGRIEFVNTDYNIAQRSGLNNARPEYDNINRRSLQSHCEGGFKKSSVAYQLLKVLGKCCVEGRQL